MACSSHRTTRCESLITYVRVYAGMLITIEQVWAVGLFDVGRRLFGVSQRPREGTVTYRRSF